MKWNFTELLNKGKDISFDQDLVIDPAVFEGNSLISEVSDLHVAGKGIVDGEHDCLYVHMDIDGNMVCPDAIDGTLIDVPLHTETDETYVMYEEEDMDDSVRLVKDDVVDLLPAVIEVILLEAPLQVTNVDEDAYPEGDGWKVYSEKEYQESQKDTIDPRLAILKQFQDER